MDLTTFLLERVAEDEAAARAAGRPTVGPIRRALRPFILRAFPVSVKRRMAATRADHPDYDPAWRPEVGA